MDNTTKKRKEQHIDIVTKLKPIYRDKCKKYYDSIILIHSAFPGIKYSDIDTTIKFLGYELSAPIMITGMTGGYAGAIDINEKLAIIASKSRIAIGVGSQKPLLESRDNETVKSYKIVREKAYDVPVIGNIGIDSLRKTSIEEIIELLDIIDADALAIHLNPAQELVQPEGNTDFSRDILNIIGQLVKKVNKPVIIKEVGTGLSMEVVELFYSRGIRYFDVAGSCGTNWIMVEYYRTRGIKKYLAKLLRNWGIPTPLSVVEARCTAPNSFIIASGGVWNGLYAVKNIALGANLVGFARPILKILVKHGLEQAIKYIERYIESIKAVMFLTGASSIKELWRIPISLLSPTKDYITQRGIDIKNYMFLRRTLYENYVE
ncbi:MAG: type 2 isopentenyl-diphosphate Delta-isomerase [Thermoprotei archaeon]